MLRASSSDFFGLASRGLQSLELDLKEMAGEDCTWAVWRAASFSGLTRLELAGLQALTEAQAERMGNLRLQELVLIDCKLTPLKLFTARALRSLERLHIEDNVLSWWKENKVGQPENISMWEFRRFLIGCGKIILSLPRLHHLSGVSSVLEVGMKNKLKSWHVSDYEDGLMSSNNDFHGSLIAARKVWTRL